jgi:hypothetical protein
MTVSESIPLTPQPWCKYPNQYVLHQHRLKELAEWLESIDAPIRLPKDRGGPDGGIDLFIGDIKVDLKYFGVELHSNSLTWSSPGYRGLRRPVYHFTETDYFIHPTDGPPSEWIAGHVTQLRTSKYGYAPYYFKNAVVTVAKLVQDVFTKDPK